MSKVLKSLIFYPLFWLRGIIRLLLVLLGGCSTIAGIIFLIGGGNWIAALLAFGTSIICFVIRFNYTVLLLKLNPTETYLEIDI